MSSQQPPWGQQPPETQPPAADSGPGSPRAPADGPPPPGYGPPPPGYGPPPAHGQPPAGWYSPPQPAGPAPGVYFAPHGERLIAYILDSLILLVVVLIAMLVAIPLGLAAGGRSAAFAPIFLGVLFVIVVSVAYFPFFWARGGQTPGMRPFNLRVVRDVDGGPIGAGQAILRLVGYWINGLVFYIGFIWVFVDVRRRGWHDLIAGTLVVKQ